jgi:hypothetical protein
MLTQSEIAKAVEAVRSLTDIVEKLHKAWWPDVDRGDILRKLDLDPPMGDAASRALAILEDAERRIARLEASRDIEAQFTPRKTSLEAER